MKSYDVVAIGACYVDFNAERFPFGEDGIRVESEVVGSEYEAVAGGSAVNFCRTLGMLGMESAFVGVCGQDVMGDALVKLLSDKSVQPFITQKPELTTNIGFNMTNETGRHIMCVAGTANQSLRFETVGEQLRRALQAAKVLYLGGCFKLKGLMPDFETIVSIAKESGVLVAVDHGRVTNDTSPEMMESVRGLVRGADYYLPSRDEFCALWNVDTVMQGYDKLAAIAPRLTVVVKDGARGAFYGDGQADPVLVSAQKVDNVVDVTGAGDACNAGVIAAVVRSRELADAVRYGCDVAAAKISKRQIPNLSQEEV